MEIRIDVVGGILLAIINPMFNNQSCLYEVKSDFNWNVPRAPQGNHARGTALEWQSYRSVTSYSLQISCSYVLLDKGA